MSQALTRLKKNQVLGLRGPYGAGWPIDEAKGRDVLVKFDDFDDPQSAGILVGRDLFAPPGLLADGSDESWDPEEFIGMVVRDEVHGDLGEVTGLEGTERNPVLVVLLGEQEVMIPLADEMILGIEPETNTLLVRTPDGLVDLYRGN